MASSCPRSKNRSLHPLSRIKPICRRYRAEGCPAAACTVARRLSPLARKPAGAGEEGVDKGRAFGLDEVKDTSIALRVVEVRSAVVTKFTPGRRYAIWSISAVHCDRSLARPRRMATAQTALSASLASWHRCSRSRSRTACAPPRPNAAPSSAGQSALANYRAQELREWLRSNPQARGKFSPASIRFATTSRCKSHLVAATSLVRQRPSGP